MPLGQSGIQALYDNCNKSISITALLLGQPGH